MTSPRKDKPIFAEMGFVTSIQPRQFQEINTIFRRYRQRSLEMDMEHMTAQVAQASQIQGGNTQPKHTPAPAQQDTHVQPPAPQKTGARKREVPDKWRKKGQQIADALAKVQRLREQERKQHNSRLIQSGLMFISTLENSSKEERDKLYSQLVPAEDTAEAARMHDVFCWAEEQALKRLEEKGV